MTNQADPGAATPAPRRLSFFGTVRTIAWAFFGVRKSASHEQDMRNLNPVHIVVAGVAGAAVFVLFLVMLVKFVLASGVAR